MSYGCPKVCYEAKLKGHAYNVHTDYCMNLGRQRAVDGVERKQKCFCRYCMQCPVMLDLLAKVPTYKRPVFVETIDTETIETSVLDTSMTMETSIIEERPDCVSVETIVTTRTMETITRKDHGDLSGIDLGAIDHYVKRPREVKTNPVLIRLKREAEELGSPKRPRLSSFEQSMLDDL